MLEEELLPRVFQCVSSVLHFMPSGWTADIPPPLPPPLLPPPSPPRPAAFQLFVTLKMQKMVCGNWGGWVGVGGWGAVLETCIVAWRFTFSKDSQLCSTKQNSTCFLKKIYQGSNWVRLILRRLCFLRTNSFHLEIPKRENETGWLLLLHESCLNCNSSFGFLFCFCFLEKSCSCSELKTGLTQTAAFLHISHSRLSLCILAKLMPMSGEQWRAVKKLQLFTPGVTKCFSCITSWDKGASQHLLLLKNH